MENPVGEGIDRQIAATKKAEDGRGRLAGAGVLPRHRIDRICRRLGERGGVAGGGVGGKADIDGGKLESVLAKLTSVMCSIGPPAAPAPSSLLSE